MFSIKQTIESLKFMVIGLVTMVILVAFIVFSAPVYIFRFLVINYLSKINYLRPQNLRSAVTLFGNMTALEFWGKSQPGNTRKTPRCAIVLSFVVRGTVTKEEFLKQIKNRWLEAKDLQSGQLLYPEFKQYIDSFMGYMFWYQDNHFNIDNHVKCHDKPREEHFHSEEFLCKLTEHLLNKPFNSRKSPWEFHLISHYENELNTALVLRVHHGLADGYSLMRCVLDGILEFEQLEILDQVISQSKKSPSSRESLINTICFPFRFLCDMGYLGGLYLRNKTFCHMYDSDKDWYQLYARSKLIPVAKIKVIRNRFGVSFTSVVLSALSRALAKLEEKKSRINGSLNIPFLFLLPVSNHSKRLTNDFAAMIFDLPINHCEGDSIINLVNIEDLIKKGKDLLIPLISRSILSPAALAQVAPIAKAFTHNYIVPCGLTSLRTSDLGILEWKGRKILECDFAVGGALGVTGIAFMVQSYGNQIRFGVTAEKGLVTREELNEFLRWVEQDIEIMYDIPTRKISSYKLKFINQ